MEFLGRLLGSTLLSGLNMLLGTAGKVVTDIHADNTTRQKNEADAGNTLASTIVQGASTAGAQRADVQKSQGAWGPFGIASFCIAMAIAFHVVMLVCDSVGWHLVLTSRLYVVPWLEWQPHVIGSWHIVALPAPFDQTEHEILKALFYVGPPSAAVAVLAKAFQR